MILALYDVTGIQDFIFSSNKTKENIGASLIVQQVFEEFLVDVLNDMSELKVETDWENSDKLLIKDDPSIDAEVIYIGGGNSLVLFRDLESGKRTTQALAVKLLNATKGSLGVVVGYQETKLESFSQDLVELHKKVAKKKDEFIQTTPLKGIAITYEAGDGLAKSSKDLSDISSDLASKKSEFVKRDSFEKLLQVPQGYSFPQEFDDLGQVEGDSFIAVVHIDGNSMGDFIDNKIKAIDNYPEAVLTMRRLSQTIRDIYIEAFREVNDVLIDKQSDMEKSLKVKLKSKKGKTCLPIRPLIINGDDITFVCNGMIALQLAELFLTKLSGKKIEREDISACAGITIIKSHYPFSRGYNLAETLCGSAKQKAKSINHDKPGSWFDYHIIYAGFNDDLEVIRTQDYDVDTMAHPSEREYPRYNLLVRPFRVTGSDVDINNWSNYTKALEQLVAGEKKMPRSRLKGLRNNFQISEEAVKEYHEINESRGYKLPNLNLNGALFKDNQTPYYEVLELMDFYLPELNFLEVKDEN